jgi:hypothetical protein
MSTVHGINVAMMLDEQPEFWAFLETTGDIWACALGDNPRAFEREPQPVAKFLKKHAKGLRRYGQVEVLIGHREHVLKPRVETRTEQVGGKRVRYPTINLEASQLLWYSYGVPDKSGILNRTGVSYHFGHFRGQQWVKQPEEFLKWAKKVLAWLRKRIADQVPVHRCNYEISATALTAAAVHDGRIHVI